MRKQVEGCLTTIINNLNGVLLDPHHAQYNNECTHVLLYSKSGSPSERILAALASGKCIFYLYLYYPAGIAVLIDLIISYLELTSGIAVIIDDIFRCMDIIVVMD